MKKLTKFHYFLPIFFVIVLVFIISFFNIGFIFGNNISYEKSTYEASESPVPEIKPLDIALYDFKLNELANNPIPPIIEPKIDPVTNEPIPIPPPKPTLWPVKTVYPNAGAILPFNRIVAYYGNLYSKKMGVLGEYPENIMFNKLKTEVEKWTLADPTTPAIPALHYIAVTAQENAGIDGKYRFRMPDKEIDKVIAMAEKINAIVFLDIQIGLSDLQNELPVFEKYLKMPQVHLGVDPEFSMKTGRRPGTVIGTFDAVDINFATDYLTKLVKENNLTPKILVVHRFTQGMVTNYKNIKTLPEVQIIMHMDGLCEQVKKKGTYRQFIYREPVQFTGFKIFYKNDIKDPNTVLLAPNDLLKLNPRPIYIQYQ